MEVRFQSPTTERNKQTGMQHLGSGNRVTRHDFPGPESREHTREKRDRAAKEERRPNMQADVEVRATPTRGRDEQGHNYGHSPFEKKQPDKEAIDFPIDFLLLRTKERLGAAGSHLAPWRICRSIRWSVRTGPGSARRQVGIFAHEAAPGWRPHSSSKRCSIDRGKSSSPRGQSAVRCSSAAAV